MFAAYVTKPSTVQACRIQETGTLKARKTKATWSYALESGPQVEFKALLTPVAGDWIVKIGHDTYHMPDSVFRERCEIAPEIQYAERGNVGHGPNPHGKPHLWQLRNGVAHCTYCGSCHPTDLVAALRSGAVLSLADMQYGWPHKHYVDKARFDMFKFYTAHLRDATPEESEALQEAMGIQFIFHDNGSISYKAASQLSSGV